ncbi:MAG: HAD domain-containing protein [Polyangiaceae bacterium]
MRVIFLDFDGVLNSDAFFERLGPVSDWDSRLDPDAVARLNRLVAATQAKIVVSSTWRYDKSVPALARILADFGFVGEVIGATPVISGPRGREIQAWLDDDQSWRSYVILDDRDDMGSLKKRLVQTQEAHGLLDEHLEQATRWLERRVFFRW